MTRIHRSLRRAALATVITTGVLAGAAAVPLGAAAPASAATSSPVAAADIISRAIDQAKKQGSARDYTAPISKPNWKVLFVGVADVKYPSGSRQTLDTAARTYTQNVINQFVDTTSRNTGVTITPTVTWVDAPFTTASTDGGLSPSETADILKGVSGVAEYDCIMVASRFNPGSAYGGLTWAWNWANAREAAYSWVSITPQTSTPGYPSLPAGSISRDTNIMIHEFAHAVSMNTVGFPYPDLHNASGYGYASDPWNEWYKFYVDYLTGKVNVNGVPQGAYPKMWQVSPRFLHNPAMATVHLQDEAGRTVAPDINTFGVGGDAYSIKAPMVNGYKTVSVKSGSAPADGQFTSGTNTEITLVYSTTPTKVAFVGGQEVDLNYNQAATPGGVYFHSYTYRSAAPVTGYTYTDQIVGNDGARRVDSLPGVSVTFGANGVAGVTKDGNRYVLRKKSDTLVEISVELKTPSTTFTIYNTGYGNVAPTARVQQMFDLLDITPKLTGVKEPLTTEPHGHTNITWGAYRVKAIFVGGETNDITRASTRGQGETFNESFVYRTGIPVSGYTYTDRLTASDGVKRLDSFGGQPITFTAAGTASFVWSGRAVTVVKKSDTLAEISVTLATPSSTFVVTGMDSVNSAPTGRGTRTLELVNVISGFDNTKDAQTAPKAISTVTWATKVTFLGGETTDLTQTKVLPVNTAHSGNWTYRATAPVTGFTYSDQIDSAQNARRADSFAGIPLTWNAAGVATVTKDGNTYTVVRKSDTRVEVSVKLGTPSTTFIAWDAGYVNTAAFGTLKQTTDLLDVTPQQTGAKEAQTTEAKGHLNFTWGAGQVG
ncbi:MULTISPECIES: MucBP domain-containing protein [unclassified Leifsonia]|uniref:MucBP domain-containing protein n=1 Tax=unclassified Leifsonia TaxID=2663824 RepID=UPI0003746493|nr:MULTISPECIES: MucBP domain-containing protein [unclassified Leifsonia]TDQ03234.1 MucBP domain-containing protein [Leifsonia sp. 115AMFTsu3.1]